MAFKKLLKLSFVVFLLAGIANHSLAAFKTNRIGNTKGLVSTPVADLLTALNSKLSDFDNSSLATILTDPSSWLTNEDIKDLNLDLSSFGGYPLDKHELAYLTFKLATAVNDGSLTLGTSQSSFQNAITDNVVNSCSSSTSCDETSADWVHGEVSDDNFSTTSMVNLITTSMLDDLISGDSNYVEGYTSKVLNANSAVSISDVRSDPFFQAIVNPSGSTLPEISEIMDAINRIAGFVEAEDENNITNDEYSSGQSVVNAFLENSDNVNFTSVNFLECYNNTESSRSGGSTTCNKTASAWDAESAILANFETYKQNITDNTTVTASNLTGIGLSLDQLGTPLEDWKIDYLNSILSDNATLVSDWQTTINSFDIQLAALWKIDQVASGATGHSDSDINILILDSAIGNNFDSSTLLGTNSSASASGFAGTSDFDNLTDPSNTAANVKSYLLTYAGYTSAQYTSWNSNSDKANFTSTNFVSCFDNTEDNRSGGSNACTVTASYWTTMSSVLQLFTEAKQDVTDGNALTIKQLDDIDLDTSSLGSDDWKAAYLGTLFDDNASTTSIWQTTIDNYDSTAASRWLIGKIAAGASGYPTSLLTTSILDDAGMESGLISTVGTSLADLKTGMTSSGISTPATVTEINDYVVSKGFNDTSQTYADMNSATSNGWTVANYKLAKGVSSSDWTNTNDHKIAFDSCKLSTSGTASPAGTCSITHSAWDAIIAAENITLAWDGSMQSTFTIAANNGDGGDNSFKGCNGWRNLLRASVSGGSGYSVVYSVDNVPSGFSSLTVDNSSGKMSYTVSNQDVESSDNFTVKARAVKNGITWATISASKSIEAVDMVSYGTNANIVRIYHSSGSSSTSTVASKFNASSPCPSGYTLSTNSTTRNNIRSLVMESWGDSPWSKPSNYELETCSSGVTTCNTAGVNNWSHAAVVFGRSGSNNCAVYENKSRNSNRTLAPDDGSCKSFSIGTSGWCKVNYACIYNGSSTKLKWPAD